MRGKLLFFFSITIAILIALLFALGTPLLTLTNSTGNVGISFSYSPISSRVHLFMIGVIVLVIASLLLAIALWFRLRILDKRRNGILESLYWRPPKPEECGISVPPRFWKTPDPFIYSQYYLIRQGLDVTWDNPDIYLALPGQDNAISGNPISDTAYEIVVLVHNNSFEAPAFHVLVNYFLYDFGIASAGWAYIGSAEALDPQGSPVVQVRSFGPSRARLAWRTPKILNPEGHYCITAELVCADDYEPANNMGQENLEIVYTPAGHSGPHILQTTLLSPFDEEHTFSLEASFYKVPETEVAQKRYTAFAETNSKELELLKGSSQLLLTSRPMNDISFRPLDQLLREQVLAANGRGKFVPPEAWKLRFPTRVKVGPHEKAVLDISLDLPHQEGLESRNLNINAFTASGTLVGGVTFGFRRARS